MDVLIADDDVVSRRLLEVTLSHAGYQVTLAANGAEALRVLEESEGPRLAVLDWMMPELDGVDVCRAVRKLASERYIYIILLTVKEQRAEIVEGLESGADDYITKPFDLDELKARLRAGKRILKLQEQLVATRDELRVRATHDSMTGLLNREAILDMLKNELSRTARVGTLSIILGDIDHFKRVNDTHGHPAGDLVLQEAARRMRSAVRAYDSVGRYGGEEFLIVSPGCGVSEAVEQANRVRVRMADEPIVVPGGSVAVTISLGVAAAASDANQMSDLLRAADQALYAAKNNGRNRVETRLQVTV
jgi:two-component system cell cycle response regulator